jgi:hypothetical protein
VILASEYAVAIGHTAGANSEWEASQFACKSRLLLLVALPASGPRSVLLPSYACMTSLGYVTFITTIFGLMGRDLLGFGQNPVKNSLRMVSTCFIHHTHACTYCCMLCAYFQL